MSSDFMIIRSNDDLQHHGVLGQKWGIRRYQNYDGSYTQKGLKRYQKSKEKYDSAKQKLNKSKTSGDKAAIKSAKNDLKTARREMSKNFDRLKLDKRADEGKKLYQKGHTIGEIQATSSLKTLGIASVAAIATGASRSKGLEVATKYGNVPIGLLFSTVGLVSGLAIETKAKSDVNKLRAYYGH